MLDLTRLTESLLQGDGVAARGPGGLLAALLIAAFIGMATAWVYRRTHHGLSYSRGFTQSLVILTVSSSLLIFVIGDSLVTAFGLLGALAIVRFRNVLKDTRDTVFVLIALVLGMATGTERFGVAFVGATVVLAVIAYLYMVSFGEKGNFAGHVTLSIGRAGSDEARARADEVVRLFCSAVERMTLHDSERFVEIVSAIRLRDPERGSEMIAHLRALPGVEDASLVLRDRYAEL